MRITGQIRLDHEYQEGRSSPLFCHTAPVFSKSLINWAKGKFNSREVCGVEWINVQSGNGGIEELVSRIRSESHYLPHSWWQLHYSTVDLNNAKLLSISSPTYLADLSQKPYGCPLSVIGNAKLKSPRSIGQLYPFPAAIAVNGEIKEKLRQSHLLGVEFTQVAVDNRKPEHKDIWLIEPSAILPPSPYSMKKPDGQPFDGDYSTGCHYVQPYSNIELSYYLNAMENMKPFDIAATREVLGNGGTTMFRHIIVTQCFRQWINASKIKGLNYTPVRLIEPSEKIFRDPLDELLAGASAS
jgi:hypothetical protein